MPFLAITRDKKLADFSDLTDNQILSAHHRLFLKMQYYNACENGTEWVKEWKKRMDCQEQLDAVLTLIQNRGLEPRIIRASGIGMPIGDNNESQS